MQRRVTRPVPIGNFVIGENNPILVQSMTNTPTEDIAATVHQIHQLVDAGCEIVRLAVPNLNSIKALAEIRKQSANIPLVADVHFSPTIALACLPFVDKVRINPGNFHPNRDVLKKLFTRAKQEAKAIRLGANWGSIDRTLIAQWGHSPETVYQNFLPFLEAAHEIDFRNIVLSFKASNVPMTVTIIRQLIEKLDATGYNFPFHLGVTEAGNGAMGRIKGAIGIGGLLLDGIGDTLRVSLTEDPVQEIAVAYDILQATQRRISQTEYIACPSCSRTSFDIQRVLSELKAQTTTLQGIKIAIMGCVVNGLGELADADFGCVGAGPGHVNLYAHGQCVKTNIAETDAVRELLSLIATHE